MKQIIFTFTFLLLSFLLISQTTISTFPWVEDFEHNGELPEDWSSEPLSVGNRISCIDNTHISGGYPDSIRSGLHAIRMFSFPEDAPILFITPYIDLSAIGNSLPGLKFYQNRKLRGNLRVYYKQQSSTEWIPLEYYRDPMLVWTESEISLAAIPTTEPIQIAFGKITHSYSADIYLDKVSIFSYSTPKPYLTSITPTSATLEWGWECTECTPLFSYKKDDTDSEWSPEFALSINQFSFAEDSLIPNTNYIVRLRGVCSSEDTLAYNYFSFTTLCAVSLPTTQSFDTVLHSAQNELKFSDCWSCISDKEEANIYVSNNPLLNLDNYLYVSKHYPAMYEENIYVLSSYLPDSISSLRVKFHAQTDDHSPVEVGYLTRWNDISSFVNVSTMNTSSEWEVYTVYFDTVTYNAKQIAIRHPFVNRLAKFYCDDITIELIPDCSEVTAVTASNITDRSATISWVNRTSNSCSLSYFADGGDTVTLTGITDDFYLLDSLSPYTTYHISIFNHCETGIWSEEFLLRTANRVPFFENFEGPNDRFSLSNRTSGNRWIIGADINAQPPGSSKSLYVTKNGSEYAYNYNSAGNDRAYTRLYFENPGSYFIEYDWKCVGRSYYDRASVWLAPVNDPIDFTSPSNMNWINLSENHLHSSAMWVHNKIHFIIYEPGIYHLIFYWENVSGSQNVLPAAIDNISVERAPCDAPFAVNLLNTDTHSAIFEIETVPTTTDIRLYYKRGVSAVWTDSVDIVLSLLVDNQFILNNLQEGTRYIYAARSLCDSVVSEMIQDGLLITQCEDYQTPYSETFTDFSFEDEVCWGFLHGKFKTDTINYSVDNGLLFDFWSSRYNTAKIRLGNIDRYNWLLTPVFEVDSGNNLALTFDLAVMCTSSWDPGNIQSDKYKFIFSCSTDGGETWDPANSIIWDYDSANIHRFDHFSPEYTTIQFPLSNYSGRLRFAFYVESESRNERIDLDIDNVTINSCIKPFNLETTPGARTVEITWGIPDSNSTLEFAYGFTGFDIDTITKTVASGVRTTLGNLLPYTDYDFYIRAVCDSVENQYTEWEKISFRTLCDPITELPWLEDFDYTGGYPCWGRASQLYDSSGVNILNDGSSSWQCANGSFNLNITGVNCHSWLETPVISLPENHTLSLEFDVRLTAYSGSIEPGRDTDDDKFMVAISTDAGATYLPANTILWDNTGNGDYSFNDLVSDFTHITIPLTSYSGNIRIAFYGESTVAGSNNKLILDNVYVGICNATITDLLMTDFGVNQASFSWARGTDNIEVWDFGYTYSGQDLDSTTIQTINDNFITIDSLDANTVYDFYLRTYCRLGYPSDWISMPFRTDCDPINNFPFIENFEDTSQTRHCWKVINQDENPYKWTLYDQENSARSGIYSYYTVVLSPYTESSDDYLISPPITLSGNERLRFFARNNNSYAPFYFEVLLSTTGIEPSDFSQTLLSSSVSSSTYMEFNIDLSAYSGITYIAFHIPPVRITSSFFFLDDVSVESIHDCMHPHTPSVATISQTSADIAWGTTGVELPHTWKIAVGLHGFNLDTVSNFINYHGTLNQYQLTGLLPGTEYDVYIQGVCQDQTSAWTDVLTFRTNCNALTLDDIPFLENFDTWGVGNFAFMDCWGRMNTYSSTSNFPNISNTFYHSPNASLYFTASSNTTVAAITPQFDTYVDISKLALNFDLLATSSGVGIAIGVMTNPMDEATFELIDTIVMTEVDVFRNYTIYLSEYDGTGSYIALKYLGSSTGGIYIDNLAIDFAPSCLPVRDLTARYDEQNYNVLLEWESDPTASEWEIRYANKADFNPSERATDIISIVTDQRPYVFDNLQSGAYYSFYVRSICSIGDTSSWNNTAAKIMVPCYNPLPLPYFEDFESYDVNSTYHTPGIVPSCWETYSNNTTFYPPHITNSGINHFPYSGNKVLTFTSGRDGDNSIVVLPEFEGSMDSVSLTFHYKMENANYGKLYLGYMSDNSDTTTFVLIKQIQSFTQFAFDSVSMLDYSLPQEAKYFAFKWHHNTSNYSCGIDDISIKKIAPVIPCDAPEHLTISNITDQSAMLTWEPGDESEWTIEYKKSSEDDYRIVNLSENNFALVNLSCTTEYRVRLKTICSHDQSEYIDTTFTTLDPMGILTLDESVTIYPNPASKTLHVETTVLFETVEIIDMLGQLIYTAKINEDNFKIDLSNYNTGVYFLKMHGKQGAIVKKFIKGHF